MASDLYENQVFPYVDRVVRLLFHPEMGELTICEFLDNTCL